MRLPTEVLDQHLRPILEGLLLWSEDSKNKFKLKVLFQSGSETLQTYASLCLLSVIMTATVLAPALKVLAASGNLQATDAQPTKSGA